MDYKVDVAVEMEYVKEWWSSRHAWWDTAPIGKSWRELGCIFKSWGDDFTIDNQTIDIERLFNLLAEFSNIIPRLRQSDSHTCITHISTEAHRLHDARTARPIASPAHTSCERTIQRPRGCTRRVRATMVVHRGRALALTFNCRWNVSGGRAHS
jgi:hypothetical protein